MADLFNKKTWVTGETITADGLNSMESVVSPTKDIIFLNADEALSAEDAASVFDKYNRHEIDLIAVVENLNIPGAVFSSQNTLSFISGYQGYVIEFNAMYPKTDMSGLKLIWYQFYLKSDGTWYFEDPSVIPIA